MALKSCCCGCSVKTGSLIVGYVYAVMSGVGLFMSILSMLVIGDVDFSQYAPEGQHIAEDDQVKVKTVMSKIYLLFAAAFLKSLVLNWLLVHGITRTKPALVLLWIIFFVTGMVMQTAMSYAAVGLVESIPTGLWYSIMSFFAMFFYIETYIVIVVSSHYHSMKKSSLLDEEQIMM